jgi:type IV secretory pathway TrbF-like protein
MGLFPTFQRPRPLSPRLRTPPLQRGLGLLDLLYGDQGVRHVLKNVLIGALLLLLGYCVVQLSFYANQTRYVPYILLQREWDGTYHVLSTPDPHWSPPNALAESDVRALIYTLHGVLLDPTENTRRWERVLKRTTERGRTKAEADYWALKEILKTHRGPIQVEIQSVLTRQALQTYEAVWTTRRFDEHNDPIRTPDGVTRWRGVFTLKFDPALAHPTFAPDGMLYDHWVISQEE